MISSQHPEPIEIAADVHLLHTGYSRFTSNVYFVRSGSHWVLVDTGLPGSHTAVIAMAEALFGADTRPAAIVLTHAHPDHTGTVRALAERWKTPVYIHPNEIPLTRGEAVNAYANALDRRLLHPLGKVLPFKALQPPNLSDVVQPVDPDTGIPALPQWRCVPTPGHTPGHMALFRPEDGVLLSGDAVLTIDLNSPIGLVSGAQRVGGPPWVTTWNRAIAEVSIMTLAALKPKVLAPGHGDPMTGHRAALRLSEFAARLR